MSSLTVVAVADVFVGGELRVAGTKFDLIDITYKDSKGDTKTLKAEDQFSDKAMRKVEVKSKVEVKPKQDEPVKKSGYSKPKHQL